MNMKSQFVTGGTTEETKTSSRSGYTDFLNASMSVMAAPSLNEQTKQNLALMGSYVDANPDTTNKARFNGYVEKVSRAHETTTAPKTTRHAKPMSGGMM